MSGNPANIRKRALVFLARREHSAAELLRKLKTREADDAAIRSVIEKLQKEGLQSDNRFIEAFIHSRVARGYGPVRITQELRSRGISDDLVHLHVDMHDPEWQQRASRARNKRFGHQLPTNYQDKAKQSRFLQQRGFSGEQIRHILNADDE
ncbi:MAG: regulatory protein RecX [Gammaproteobacteria bacterium]|nr:regulatory protein RecX [Gammaproteobacteria bacterium]